MRLNDKLTIYLDNGNKLVAELYNHAGIEKEISVHIENASGVCIQDICTVKAVEEIECLVWGDENSEDYTDEFYIPLYKEV